MSYNNSETKPKMRIENTTFENLPSVGSAISNHGFIYPLNADGTVDTFDKVDLNDASDEWLSALSETDAATVNDFKAN